MKGPTDSVTNQVRGCLILLRDILSYICGGHPCWRAEARRCVELGFGIIERASGRSARAVCFSLRRRQHWKLGLQSEETQVEEIMNYILWLLLLGRAGSVVGGAVLGLSAPCVHQQLCWHNCGVENWGKEGKGFLEQNAGIMPDFTLKGSLETWRDYSTSCSTGDAIISCFH